MPVRSSWFSRGCPGWACSSSGSSAFRRWPRRISEQPASIQISPEPRWTFETNSIQPHLTGTLYVGGDIIDENAVLGSKTVSPQECQVDFGVGLHQTLSARNQDVLKALQERKATFGVVKGLCRPIRECVQRDAPRIQGFQERHGTFDRAPEHFGPALEVRPQPGPIVGEIDRTLRNRIGEGLARVHLRIPFRGGHLTQESLHFGGRHQLAKQMPRVPVHENATQVENHVLHTRPMPSISAGLKDDSILTGRLDSASPPAMSTSDLAKKSCVPCKGGVPPLKGKDLEALAAQLPEWTVVEEHHLHREYSFPNFAKALQFVNRVGEVAEKEGHHPDIWFTWGQVKIDILTHAIDGLTESDFVLAAKIEELPR
jgi:4a-hydroxytetrahydrobiopterin dehydratase